MMPIANNPRGAAAQSPVESGVKGEVGLRLSVVVPCYNEEENIPELYRRLQAACRSGVGESFELIFVNDGSQDNTWSSLCQLAETDRHVVGVNLSRNHGHQLALTAGLSFCRGERILIIDADLQDPPELLEKMMSLMDEGAEVVYGQRISRKGDSWFKRGTAALFYRLLRRMADVAIPPDTGDFRLISRRALNVLHAMPEQYRFIRGMISWIGFRQVPLLYERAPRFAGKTKYPLKRMVRFAMDAVTGFSIQPLRLSIYLSLLTAGLGLILLAYAFISFLFLRAVQGWTSLITVVLLLGSVQMFMLGIMGEYVGRLYMEAKRRPLFVISDVARMKTDTAA